MIHPRGDPKSRIWVVTDEPYPKDYKDGHVFSSGLGYVFDKAWTDAGIGEAPFIVAIQDSVEIAKNPVPIELDYKALLVAIEQYKPPLICTLGEKTTGLFCPATRRKKHGIFSDEASLEKWAGSLLESPNISYGHYCIPQLKPDKVASNWEYRPIYVGIDLGRVRDEYDFLARNQRLQSLPMRDIIIQPTYNDLIELLYDFYKTPILGCDIETVRPVKGGKFYGWHPGYPYLLALADTPNRGVSFSLWDYDTNQAVNIWSILDDLLSRVPQVGQNYFTFDSHFLEALGLRLCLDKCQDTMLRHHVLWPALPHKLQFLTKQYTRQPYYKDEGRYGSPKSIKPWMNYNALDAVITLECYLEQEGEFNDRAYLK